MEGNRGDILILFSYVEEYIISSANMSPVNKYGRPEGPILHLREHTVLLFISSQKDLNVVSL